MAVREKFSRKDLKKPDEFLSTSEKLLDYCKSNQRALVTFVLGMVVLIAAVGIVLKNRQVQANRMETLLYQMAGLEAKGEGPEALKKYLDQFANGIQKQRAKLILADAYFKNKKSEESVKLYQEVLEESASESLFHELAQLGLAYSYEQNNEKKKAADAYKTVIDQTTQLPLFNVYFSLARVYEQEQDSDNALLILREMKTKFPDHAQLNKVEKKIEQLEKLA